MVVLTYRDTLLCGKGRSDARARNGGQRDILAYALTAEQQHNEDAPNKCEQCGDEHKIARLIKLLYNERDPAGIWLVEHRIAQLSYSQKSRQRTDQCDQAVSRYSIQPLPVMTQPIDRQKAISHHQYADRLHISAVKYMVQP